MKDMKARDIMSPEVFCVHEEMPVRELAALFAQKEISGAPVVAADGSVLGLVSVSDVAKVASGSSAVAPDRANPSFYLHGWEDRVNPDELRQLRVEDEGLLVRDIMTSAVYSVKSDAAVPEIASAMVKGHLHRVLVVGDKGVLGIVSSLDILKLVAVLA